MESATLQRVAPRNVRGEARGEGALLVVAGVLLIVGSTLDRWNMTIGDINIYPSQVLAVALIPLGLARRPALSKVRTAALILLGVTVVGFMPAVLLLSEGEVRLRIVLQIAANLLSFVIAFAVFDALSEREFTRLLRYVVVIALTGVALQSVLAPRTDSRFLGLPRPSLLFSEPTWLAMAAAMVLAAALALRMRYLSVALGAIVLVIFTRSALVMAAVGLLMCFRPIRKSALVRLVVILGVSAASFAIVWDALTAMGPVAVTDSLDTRALDVWVIRVANGDDFLPWGGDVLTARIEGFWRETRGGSNVAIVEYLWKFGLGGVCFLAVWTLAVALALPRLLFRSESEKSNDRVWIVWMVLAILPAVVQINNALGQPWLWILTALLLTTGMRVAAQDVDGFGGSADGRGGVLHRVGRGHPSS